MTGGNDEARLQDQDNISVHSTPSSRHKRTRRMSDSDNSGTVVKKKRIDNRPTREDLDEDLQPLAVVALEDMRALLVTIHAFPDHTRALQFIRRTWSDACQDFDVQEAFDVKLVGMVRGPATRLGALLKVLFDDRSGTAAAYSAEKLDKGHCKECGPSDLRSPSRHQAHHQEAK